MRTIRSKFQCVLTETNGDRKAAKEAIAADKKKLPGILWSGQFSRRANDALIEHSGLICADLDELGLRLSEVRKKLLTSSYLLALFRSPTGDGLKAIFRVPNDAAKHLASFRSVQRHVMELTGVQIDEACKDVARLCFVSSDLGWYYKPNALELVPPVEREKAKVTAQPNEHNYKPDMAVTLFLAGCFFSCRPPSFHQLGKSLSSSWRESAFLMCRNYFLPSGFPSCCPASLH
jgi:hypothetical protein